MLLTLAYCNKQHQKKRLLTYRQFSGVEACPALSYPPFFPPAMKEVLPGTTGMMREDGNKASR
ncbi:hypothetical protein KTH_07540 [Thermosporothrix hazakensis]|nr:hypothetical protein KTH_07540 [Thermosporothrix hazakensis]